MLLLFGYVPMKAIRIASYPRDKVEPQDCDDQTETTMPPSQRSLYTLEIEPLGDPDLLQPN